jgi:hypothetical protein
LEVFNVARLTPADYKRMYPNTRVEGLEQVMNNLNKELAGIKARSMKGLILSAALIRRETETTPPLTPVDTGNLRASWFVVSASAVQAGSGNKQFKGKKASQMELDHTSTLEEAQAMVRAKSGMGREFIILGYSANYGIFVHEKLDMHDPANPYWKNKKWRPGSGPKWLQQAIDRNRSRILQIVRDNAKIGK